MGGAERGGGPDSVSDRQSYLPCKSAFINATFVGKIIGEEEAKAHQLLVKHQDVIDGATATQRQEE